VRAFFSFLTLTLPCGLFVAACSDASTKDDEQTTDTEMEVDETGGTSAPQTTGGSGGSPNSLSPTCPVTLDVPGDLLLSELSDEQIQHICEVQREALFCFYGDGLACRILAVAIDEETETSVCREREQLCLEDDPVKWDESRCLIESAVTCNKTVAEYQTCMGDVALMIDQWPQEEWTCDNPGAYLEWYSEYGLVVPDSCTSFQECGAL
jgi:hypothetical protein